jgi:hypothetical protein
LPSLPDKAREDSLDITSQLRKSNDHADSQRSKMRLIDTSTLELKEFPPGKIPEYAILSHTWEDGEVTLQDWQDIQRTSAKPGFKKIWHACHRAQADGLAYLWADTNCIDKSSSAELSEAINSMFTWYQDSAVCYTFLSDVQGASLDTGVSRAMAESRWFTRGWTLQELLAPRRIVFFSSDWTEIGTKASLKHAISERTGISEKHLILNETTQQWVVQLSEASVAQRMSWIATRTTTRPEDVAYCMLGIFGVNMPLLYGEGTRAFVRLQEEIIKVSNDQTIFCWEWVPSLVPQNWTSMLAPSPTLFESSDDYVRMSDAFEDQASVFSITNAGLSIVLPTIWIGDRQFVFLRALSGRQSGRACIALRRVGMGQYWRLTEPSRPITLSMAWAESAAQFYVTSPPAIWHYFRNNPTQWTQIHLERGGHAVMLCFDISYQLITTYPSHPESRKILPLIQTGDDEASALVMVATKFRDTTAGIFFKVRFPRPGSKHSIWSCHLFRATSEILWDQKRMWQECRTHFGPLRGERSQISKALKMEVEITSFNGQFLLDRVHVRLAKISPYATQRSQTRQRTLSEFFDRIWKPGELEAFMDFDSNGDLDPDMYDGYE